MAAITYNTNYDIRRLHSRLHRVATGDSIAVKPGDLIIGDSSEGTVYVLNYKMERQPVSYAGFMKYYAAPGDNPFANVKTISMSQLNNYPQGALITDTTPKAVTQAPLSLASFGSNKVLLYGVIIILAIVAYKFLVKKRASS